ncbi:MAG: M56 family metallopeptidase [Pyrinomonadaceae bacterium]
MYFLLCISLIFTLLLAINIISSITAEIFWRVVSPFLKNVSAHKRAQFIFALAVLPFAGAFVLVFAFLLPAYLLFEPHESEEVVSLKLALLTFVSLIGIFIASFRVFRTWQVTHNLVSNWLENAEVVEIRNISIPVHRINHQFPVIAVVGIFRPQMFIAEKIFDSLNPAELEAALAHEYGHLTGYDNLKRTILRISRDLLIFPLGKTLERAWAETAESAADEFAAQTGGNSTALNLAAALIKIARIVPQNASPAMPLGAFLIEENNTHITARVRRLLQLAGNLNSLKRASSFNLRLAQIGSALVFVSILVLATNHSFLFLVHTILEKFVAALQ